MDASGLMKRIFVALFFVALAACETLPPEPEFGFKPGMTLIVTGVCQSVDAAMAIAEASEQDAKQAETVTVAQYQSGACQFWRDPNVMVLVLSVIHSYRDYNGRPTQVLKVRAAGPPEKDLYTLVLAARAVSQKPKP